MALGDLCRQGGAGALPQGSRLLARTGNEGRARETLFKMALTYHLAFDFKQAEEMYDEVFCCRVDGPRHEPTELLTTVISKPETIVPGEVYSIEGMQVTEHLFRRLCHDRRRAERAPVDG